MNKITDGVFFFSKAGCPYCIKLEKDLVHTNTPFQKYVPVDQKEADKIKRLSKHPSFPILYINKNLVGGYNEYCTLALTNQIACCDF